MGAATAESIGLSADERASLALPELALDPAAPEPAASLAAEATPKPIAVAPLVREVVRVNALPAKPARPMAPTRTLRVIMAGGGTGGHLYPGLAVAEALEDLAAEQNVAVELLWAATPRQVDKRLLSSFGDRYIPQPVQPLIWRNPFRLWGFWNGWEKSCLSWKRYFRKNHVDAVLALGGYAAGPAAHVAAKFGVPVGLLNPDAVPGLANRFLLKRADVVFTQWELPAKLAKGIAGEVMALGCPIRGTLLGRSRAEGATRLGLDPTRPTLVITGGSLAAKNINDAIVALMKDAALCQVLTNHHWQIIHLTGAEQRAAVEAAYAPHPAIAARVLDYCDDMASVWAVADLAIARAGASTCAELAACGVPSVLLPYPYHRDLHQKHNAEHLVKAKAAVLVDDVKEVAANAAAVKSVLLSLLSDPQRRGSMAAAARQAGKPNASRDIAAQMMKLMES